VVFEEFKQVGDLASQRKGTGLGLAIARRLARMHDGALSASSEPGRGATFRVEFPLAPPGASPTFNEAIDLADSLGKIRSEQSSLPGDRT
jgi:K+-sensing histidine kinase KdpD